MVWRPGQQSQRDQSSSAISVLLTRSSHLISLCLGLLIRKMRMATPVLRDCCKGGREQGTASALCSSGANLGRVLPSLGHLECELVCPALARHGSCQEQGLWDRPRRECAHTKALCFTWCDLGEVSCPIGASLHL